MSTLALAFVILASIISLFWDFMQWAFTGDALAGGKEVNTLPELIIALITLTFLIGSIVSYFLMSKKSLFKKLFILSFVGILLEIGGIFVLIVLLS